MKTSDLTTKQKHMLRMKSMQALWPNYSIHAHQLLHIDANLLVGLSNKRNKDFHTINNIIYGKLCSSSKDTLAVYFSMQMD